MTLLQWLTAAQEKGGLSHMVVVQGLRKYLRETDERIVVAEIKAIQNVPKLRYLQEAGLPGSLYAAYIDHLEGIDDGRE